MKRAIRWRLVSVVLVTACVGALLLWQADRERRLVRCIADGLAWDGPSGQCVRTPPGILLERDLKRS
jgi:hypothetical protein